MSHVAKHEPKNRAQTACTEARLGILEERLDVIEAWMETLPPGIKPGTTGPPST